MTEAVRSLSKGRGDIPTGRTLTASEAAAYSGLTYRQVDYYARTGLLVPSVQVAFGSGSRRLYHPRDVAILSIIHDLRVNGMTLPGIRRAKNSLAEIDDDQLFARDRIPEVCFSGSGVR